MSEGKPRAASYVGDHTCDWAGLYADTVHVEDAAPRPTLLGPDGRPVRVERAAATFGFDLRPRSRPTD